LVWVPRLVRQILLPHEVASALCVGSAYGDARDRLDALEPRVRAELEGVPA
jgi:hypothetical protein